MKGIYKSYRCRRDDTEKMSNNYSSQGTYLQVAVMVFIIHTISYICDSRSKISRLAVVNICLSGLWYIFL